MVANVSGVLKTYEVFKSEERHPAQKSNRQDDQKDTVAISDKAQDYQSARTALSNTPDVREDLVSAMIRKYESNAGAVSASDIADKLLGGL